MFAKHHLSDIELKIGMILRDLDSSGIYSYVKIIEYRDGQYYYDHSEDLANFHHGFRRNASDLGLDRIFEIIHNPYILSKDMYLCFQATNQGNLVVEKNIHCKEIPFELNKYLFLCDGLTEAQRRFLEKVTCENFETRYIKFNSFCFAEFVFQEV